MRNPTINHFFLLMTIGMIALFMACGVLGVKKLPTKNYYIINYPFTKNVPQNSRRPYPYALQIGNFEIQPIYNRQNVVYRYSPNQIQYYEVERWAVRPDYMITNLVFKHLEESGLTNRVGTNFFESRPDYRIEGMVESIERYDAGDIFFAHLAMSMKMLRVADGTQVWEYTFDERKQVYQRGMVYTVQGLSAIFQSEMNIVVAQIDSLFLSYGSGTPLQKKEAPDITQKPAQTDSTKSEIDESAFEIIPDKRPKEK
ncbi:PqiC family protein [bacterium]|nr:PqiC family protein [bacterium]